VITISGDEIGLKHLKAQIGNVSAYVAMAHAIGGFTPATIIDTFLSALKKRRIPETVLQRNREALDASLTEVKEGVFDEAKPGTHQVPPFAGYGVLPVGAQTALRLSQDNLTAYYARSGLRLHFADPEDKCTGCGHCITNCPEGIIHWEPNEKNGLKVTGSDVTDYCKLCAECISVCPENLFSEIPFVEAWKEAEVSS
jgi:ferredoxin